MKHSVWYVSVAFAGVLQFGGCNSGDEPPTGNTAEKVKAKVKEAVTQDFKHYEAAKKSLAESAQKGKAELDLIDKELK